MNPLPRLTLTRPLAVLDLETTGVAVKTDRIVEISVLKVLPDGTSSQTTRRLNPGVPIPPEATAVHGITDDDVRHEPTFGAIAWSLDQLLAGCDLAGFAIRHFDLPMLCAEFRRVNWPFLLSGRALIDVMDIFKRYHPRTLTAAVQHYLGRDHAGAHGAAADTLVTAEVLNAMLAQHGDLEPDVGAMHKRFAPTDGAVDIAGFFVKRDGVIRFAHGKHKGRPLAEIAKQAPDYLRWMQGQDFLDDTKQLARDALR